MPSSDASVLSDSRPTLRSMVNDFAVALREERPSANGGFFLFAGFLELLRHASPAQIKSAAKFLSALVEHDFLSGWSNITFSLTHQLMSQQYEKYCLDAGIPQEDISFVLSMATALLAEAAFEPDADGPREIDKSIMIDRVKAVLSIFHADAKEAVPDSPPPLPPRFATLDATRYMPSGFSPSPLSYSLLADLQAEFISHRAVMTNGELSSEVRGLALHGPKGSVAFLESGEFIPIVPNQEGLSVYSDIASLKSFPHIVFLYFILAADGLYSAGYITEEQRNLLTSGQYGNVDDTRITVLAAAADNVSVLDEALFAAASFVQTPGNPEVNPVVVDFDFMDAANSSKAFRLAANYSASGAYINSKFGVKEHKEEGDAKFIPSFSQTNLRFITAHGAYVFPAPESSLTYALIVL
jgi:hypothetical protein